MPEFANAFSLRAIVRKALNSSALADPRALAAVVLDSLGEDQLRDALAETLPDFVRLVIAGSRANAVSSPSPGSGRSWKVEALQDYGKLLRQRIHVANTWKFLGDCGADDLFAAAAERRNIAAQTLIVAERYERLGKAVEHAGVTTVRNLSTDALQQAWEVAE